jgi:electron transport complex protein RnfB
MIWAVITLGGLGFLASIALGMASRRFHVEVDPRIEAIDEALPQANCGACGYPGGCRGYAKDIVESGVPVDLCGPGGPEVAQKIAGIMGQEVELGERKMAVVCCAGSDALVRKRFEYQGVEDCRAAELFQAGAGSKACPYGCLGLGSCVRACPFDAISLTGDGLAVVDPEKCTGCGNCIEVCPRGIIKLIPVSAPIAVLCNFQGKGSAVRKICPVGCTGCGVCVKRAKQDAIKLVNDLPVIDYSVPAEGLDVAELCPPFTIIDLRKYSPAEWLSSGREEFKQQVRDKKKKKKAEEGDSNKKPGGKEKTDTGDSE